MRKAASSSKPSTLNVFEGPLAIEHLLHPEHSLPLPLIELPDSLNPLRKKKVRIFGKAMFLSPLFNIKVLAALNLLTEAKRSGKLKGVHTIVENSSGNMVLAYAVIARMFGIANVVAIVPRDIAPGKFEILRLFGVDPEYSNETPGAQSGIEKARAMGKRRGFFNPGQYENKANPSAYEKWLMPEISKQTKGKMTVFCAGLGTTGTIVGSSRYLRKHAPKVKIVGVVCADDQAVPGVRSIARLKEIKFDWRSALDECIEVRTKESFKKSLDMCRVGLMAGPSSGFALAGLLKYLESQTETSLKKMRNSDGEVVAVFICPDPSLLYLEKYSTHLDPQDLA